MIEDAPAIQETHKKALRYHAIRDTVRREIEEQQFKPGERLPSDGELALRFDASRLTVIRALRELEGEGLVQRRAGSGTYVRPATGGATREFGILMPDIEDGEVFEPISQGIARAGEMLHHRLLWGSSSASGQVKEKYAEELCQYFRSRKVAGVFYAPVELTDHHADVNQRIMEELTQSGIPVVLVDRCPFPYPERSRYDLVGIDNHRAGYRMTAHLFQAGCRRVAFAFRPNSAATVEARMNGYRTALRGLGYHEELLLPFAIESANAEAVQEFLERHRPDGIVGANDLTAARLMQTLLRLGVRIPADLRIVGINDVKYAEFLPVPLTTLRQPCQQIGAAAMATMLDRLENPGAPVRDVLLECQLVVRQSCGVVA